MSESTAEGSTTTPPTSEGTPTEVTMSNPTSSPSGSGTTADSSDPTPSPPSAGPAPDPSPPKASGSSGSESIPGGSGESDDEDEKRKVDRFNPAKIFASADRATKPAAGSTDPKIIEDVNAVNAGTSRLRPAAARIGRARDAVEAAAEERDATDATLTDVLQPVEWFLRTRSGGRKYVTDCQKNSRLDTANAILAGLEGSGFEVPNDLMQALNVKLSKAQAADDAYAAAQRSFKAAVREYSSAKRQTLAAVAMLRGSMQWVKANARSAGAKPPVKHPAPVDQPTKASVRVSKNQAAHSKKKKED